MTTSTSSLAIDLATASPLPGLLPVDVDRVQEALASARSPATRRVYASQWGVFTRWAGERGAESLPADPSIIAAYLAERARDGASVATLQVSRAAIAAAHVDANLDDPCAHPGLRRTLSGLARLNGRPPRQALGLTNEVAAAIRASALFPRRLPSGRTETHTTAQSRGLVDIALVSVMRDGLLRRSEASMLTWADIEQQPDSTGRILVQQSKTDQVREGKVLYLGVRSMNDLEAIRPAGAGDTGQMVFRLSGSQIGRRIARACEVAGYPGAFSGHSPRVGMAQDLLTDGASLPGLMEAGRWDSPVMPARYTRSLAAGRGAVAAYHDGT